jgi:hypothetical protein
VGNLWLQIAMQLGRRGSGLGQVEVMSDVQCREGGERVGHAAAVATPAVVAAAWACMA